MNKYQKRIDQLLKEVIGICDKNEIPWFVSGRSAIRSYQGDMYQGGFLDMNITIPASSIVTFINVCQDMQGRYVEGYHNNPNFSGLYLKYVDTTTTLISYNEGLSCRARGFFVKINLLRKVPNDKEVWQRAIKYENLIEDTADTYVDLTGKTLWPERVLFRAKKQLDALHHKKIFDYLINAYSCEDSSQVAIRTIEGKMHCFEKNRFDELDVYSGDSCLVWLPKNVEQYFVQCYGVDWKEYSSKMIGEGKKGDIIHDGINYLLSLMIPYPYFVEELKKQGIDKRFLRKRQKKLEVARRESKILAPVNEAWDLANRAGDLWNIYDHYKEKKSALQSLYDAGEFFLLEKELQYYDEIVQKYYSLNMGFMYDDELWDIYLYIKRFTASKEISDSIKNLAEQDEKLKIQLKDMELEINESIGLHR